MDAPDLPDYAGELECELAFGIAKCTPEEGIRLMEARIKGLDAELAAAREGQDFTAAQERIMPKLNDAIKRLDEYKLLRDGKN